MNSIYFRLEARHLIPLVANTNWALLTAIIIGGHFNRLIDSTGLINDLVLIFYSFSSLSHSATAKRCLAAMPAWKEKK